MKLDQLRTFLAVATHASFSRAAQALGLSQSTVSFQIAALEADAGCRLLDRRRGVRVTQQGEVLRKQALRILGLVDDTLAELQAAEVEPRGQLHVAASTIVAEHLLPALLRDLRSVHPQVGVTVMVSDSRGALDALTRRRCDVALVGKRPRGRQLESRRFAADAIVLVGPPGAPKRLRASDLASLPLILREEGSGTRAAVADLLAAADLDRPDVLLVGSTQAARRCVLAGLGFSFISRHAVDEDLRRRRMREIAIAGTPLVRSFHAARLRAATPSPAAGAFFRLVSAAETTSAAEV